MALQPDGKIVVAGHEYRYLKTTGSDFVVARYNPDGSRDDTFSGDGLVTMDFGGHDDEAKAIVVQPDDKIVVAGYSVELDADDVPSRDFALARYNPDGTLDATFSGDGKRTTNFADDTAHDIALQPDGKIVVGGSASGDFALVRYDQDGHLDPTFSGDGRATVGLTDAQGTGARAIVIQPNREDRRRGRNRPAPSRWRGSARMGRWTRPSAAMESSPRTSARSMVIRAGPPRGMSCSESGRLLAAGLRE